MDLTQRRAAVCTFCSALQYYRRSSYIHLQSVTHRRPREDSKIFVWEFHTFVVDRYIQLVYFDLKLRNARSRQKYHNKLIGNFGCIASDVMFVGTNDTQADNEAFSDGSHPANAAWCGEIMQELINHKFRRRRQFEFNSCYSCMCVIANSYTRSLCVLRTISEK